ncbi:hypothetical protein HY251_02900 [bacterium]|nr:hypothetical protein [bacterium]
MGNEALVLIICVAAVVASSVAAVLVFFIREMARVRLEETKMRGAGLGERELDQIAERVASRIAKTDADRKLLLDLAKMSEIEFAQYREQLRVEMDGHDRRDLQRERAREL